MPVARLSTSLVISRAALLATALLLSVAPARATVRTPLPEYDTSQFRYTDKSAAAATVGRTIDLYIVEEQFDAAERERIGLALQQWNHVLNGYVRFRVLSLQGDPSDESLTQLVENLAAPGLSHSASRVGTRLGLDYTRLAAVRNGLPPNDRC